MTSPDALLAAAERVAARLADRGIPAVVIGASALAAHRYVRHTEDIGLGVNVAMRDLAEESPLEVEASKHSLNYIKLDGNIACLVNGAGLAMATMDIIKHFGGDPANFLDVGGGASKDQVSAAFRIILSDPSVKGILVNIFGGIMDCNVIATGIVEAVLETGLSIPLVVRLEGNNVQAGKKALAESGLTITSGDSMADAAQKIVKAVRAA